jgi:hypothetical protein
VAPEFVETQMPLALATATNLVPSADEATAVQFVTGALVCVHVWANVKLAVSKAAEATSRFPKVFIGRLNEPLSFNHFMKSLSSQPFSYGLPVAWV